MVLEPCCVSMVHLKELHHQIMKPNPYFDYFLCVVDYFRPLVVIYWYDILRDVVTRLPGSVVASVPLNFQFICIVLQHEIGEGIRDEPCATPIFFGFDIMCCFTRNFRARVDFVVQFFCGGLGYLITSNSLDDVVTLDEDCVSIVWHSFIRY